MNQEQFESEIASVESMRNRAISKHGRPWSRDVARLLAIEQWKRSLQGAELRSCLRAIQREVLQNMYGLSMEDVQWILLDAIIDRIPDGDAKTQQDLKWEKLSQTKQSPQSPPPAA